jgi:hypothetical protein
VSPLPLLPVVPVLPILPLPVSPVPVFPVVPVPPELPLVPLLPVEVVPPPPTGAAPPAADDTGIVVVVVDGGVVVVVVLVGVVVVVVDAAEPVAGGVAGTVPATARMAVGTALARCGDGVLTTMALPCAGEVVPADAGSVPPDWLTVPMGPVLVGPAGWLAPGTVVVVLGCEETGPLAESTLWAIGPAPILRPATTESAAAATAPDATRRLRTKKSFDAMIGSGAATRRGALGSGWPKERDVKTSSRLASSFASAHSGLDAPMFLHNNRLFGWAHASRSTAPEVQTPPQVQPYNGGSNVNTGKPECGLELVRTAVCTLKSQVLLHSSCTNCAPFRAVVVALCDVVPCPCDVASLVARRVCFAHATAAINVQPNGNAPLLQGRRAHRLIDRVEDTTHRAGHRARCRCRRGNGAPELVREASD